jgi:ABC-2 type transport system ATP-binding protein
VQFVVTVLHKPKLLIFDEPFSGFDPVNANLIKDEILELKQKGATIIFSTHRMESVEELCDDIALIHKSNKLLDGKLNDSNCNLEPILSKLVSSHQILKN